MTMKKTLLVGVLSSIVLFGAGCASTPTPNPTPVTTPLTQRTAPTPTVKDISNMNLAFPGVLPAAEVNQKVLVKTTLGDIVIQVDQTQGPNAASNFVYLVKKGFYDGLIFHRVIPGFMIQGGDPTGSGMGGPGYKFADDPVKSSYQDGVVAMANAGPNTNGSQFFIMVADTPLPPAYSVFGKVISGLDIAHKISAVDRDDSDRPYEEVKILSASIQP